MKPLHKLSLTVCSALLGAALAAACSRSSSPDGGSGAAPAIKVLSNRADLVNGGDALLEIVPPAAAASLSMELNGHDVSDRFARRADGHYIGLVTGLAPGNNTVRARSGSGSATATLVNHANGGPVFAGPQSAHWVCQDGAVDAQCNQPPTYAYFYKSSNPAMAGLQPYDPDHPPADVASTTTDDGVTVPFIVRVETGYQDRDQYRIAVLFQPQQAWSALDPQPQFNHKLLITHGASCGVDYASAQAPSVLSHPDVSALGLPVTPPTPMGNSAEYALGKGYAVMSTALDNNGHNCDVVIQAESLMMAKEHLIESYGTLRYTIGAGCSGGSLATQWIANAYPGIYQGILPTCSFPDAWTAATQVADYHLLRAYFEQPQKWGSGVAWTPTQMADVDGHVTHLNAIASVEGYFSAVIPTHACGGVSDAERYQPQTNSGGVRCSIIDLAINVFGPRPPEVWSASETALGRGFGGIAVDNVGVQYGLGALRAGRILPAQFVDLNRKIGGLDIDINAIPERTPADQPALANAYRSGMINETNNLDATAIIDCRGPDPGAAHDAFRAFAIRARLDREHGSHANQLIWEGPAVIFGDTLCAVQSLAAMDRWLAAVEQDGSTRPLSQKIAADKPADLGDRCYDGNGDKLTDALCGDAVVPVYGTPRMVAGDAITTDTNKCQLKLLDRGEDYGPLSLTDGEWAQLQALFPSGVCDYSKPGVSQQPTIPWLTYQDDRGAVVYGGKPLPPSPANSGGGWASPAFQVFASGS